MKITLLLFLVLLCALCAYGFYFLRKVSVSKELIARAHPFVIEGEDRTTSVLVLGDSTGVGVGVTDRSESVAGLFAKEVGATSLENYAVSGARVSDLSEQITHAKHSQYSYVLIQIGGNDVIRFGDLERAGEELMSVLQTLPSSEKVIVLSAGNVGAAVFFPHFLRPTYHSRTRNLHRIFEKVVGDAGATYVNLYTEPKSDPFVAEPSLYLAEDGLHPSSAGYLLWFEKVKEVLK